jgi:hypothetical protein
LLKKTAAIAELANFMTKITQDSSNRLDCDGAIELFLKVVRGIRTEGDFAFQVIGDADSHTRH